MSTDDGIWRENDSKDNKLPLITAEENQEQQVRMILHFWWTLYLL